jgi:phage shock protein PspC (stress-responsive transcriptional regulator)
MQTTAAEQIKFEKPTPLPFRDDTMLGVCTALSEDFGINANLLRVLVGALVLFNVTLAVAVYLGLGAAVAIGRLLFPPRRVPVQTAARIDALVEANDAEAASETLAA